MLAHDRGKPAAATSEDPKGHREYIGALLVVLGEARPEEPTPGRTFSEWYPEIAGRSRAGSRNATELVSDLVARHSLGLEPRTREDASVDAPRVYRCLMEGTRA